MDSYRDEVGTEADSEPHLGHPKMFEIDEFSFC